MVRKIVAFLMVAVLLFTVAPVSGLEMKASAETGYNILGDAAVCDESTVEMYNVNGSSVCYIRFVPEVSGEYACYLVEDKIYSTDLSLCDKDFSFLVDGRGGRFGLWYTLFKGETYYFRFDNEENSSVVGSVGVTISLDEEQRDIIEMYPGDSVQLDTDFNYSTIRFVPEETGVYDFYSDSSNEGYCELEYKKSVIESDCAEEDYCGFSFKRVYEEGKEYYFKVHNYGETEVFLSEKITGCLHENIDVVPEVHEDCNNHGYTEGEYCNDCGEWISGHKRITAEHTDADADGKCEICTEDAKLITAEGMCGENVYWTIYNNNELIISGEGLMYNYGGDEYSLEHAYVPYYDYIDDITTVAVEDGITGIGAYAFADFENLVCVTLPEKLIKIGAYAFYGCRSLTDIVIPDNLRSLGSWAFAYCVSLENISLPGTIKTYPDHVFSDCQSIKEYTVAEGTEDLSYYPFIWCDNLEVINIPASVTLISDTTFVSCENIKEFNVHKDNEYYYTDEYGVLYNAEKTILIAYPKGSDIEEYNIPDHVLEIEDRVFEEAKNLKKVTFPDHIDSISFQMFSTCESLESFVVPAHCTEIGSNAFSHNPSLKSVTLNNMVESMGRCVFYDCPGLEEVVYPSKVNHLYYTFSIGSDDLLNKIVILNPDCVIEDEFIYLSHDATSPAIYGFGGSTAESYANNKGFDFIAIDESGINKIEIESLPFKTTYALGDNFDSSGLSLKVTYNDGNSYIMASGYEVEGYNPEATGEQTLTVNYEGKSVSFDAEVIEKMPVKIYSDTGLATSFSVRSGYTEYFEFVPEYDGNYCFNLWNEIPCEVIVFDSEFSELYSVQGDNYTDISYVCNAGEIYYFGVISDEDSDEEACHIYCEENLCSHNEVVLVNGVSPTCFTYGYTEGEKCLLCSGWASGHKRLYSNHTDNDGDNMCDICEVKISEEISVDETLKVDALAENYKYIKFTPEVSGNYRMRALNDEGVELFDENFKRIFPDPEEETNEWCYYFAVEEDLYKGNTYYFRINAHEYSNGLRMAPGGYFKVMLTCNYEIDDEDEPDNSGKITDGDIPEPEEPTTEDPSDETTTATTPSTETTTTKPTATVPSTKPTSTTPTATQTTTTAPVTVPTTTPTTTEKDKTETVKAEKPTKVTAKKVKSTKKKQAVVTWNKVKTANGYQVAYSTTKKFTKKTTKTKLIKKAKTTKTTLKKLKSGKKYFIKVRAYKTVNGKKTYGAWSKVKTVKVK